VAIDPSKPHFNKMDVLLSARVCATLAAWTGRPKPIAVKKDNRYVAQLQPDPTVTQFYIPGLDKIRPGALTLERHRNIPRGAVSTPA
jgi:hypothetical protein